MRSAGGGTEGPPRPGQPPGLGAPLPTLRSLPSPAAPLPGPCSPGGPRPQHHQSLPGGFGHASMSSGSILGAGEERKGDPRATKPRATDPLRNHKPRKETQSEPFLPPHFTRSHELWLTGSCFSSWCPLRACPSPAGPRASPRAVSACTAWQGEPQAVAQETRSTGPGTQAALEDDAPGTPTCKGSSPWTHGRIHTHV